MLYLYSPLFERGAGVSTAHMFRVYVRSVFLCVFSHFVQKIFLSLFTHTMSFCGIIPDIKGAFLWRDLHHVYRFFSFLYLERIDFNAI